MMNTSSTPPLNAHALTWLSTFSISLVHSCARSRALWHAEVLPFTCTVRSGLSSASCRSESAPLDLTDPQQRSKRGDSEIRTKPSRGGLDPQHGRQRGKTIRPILVLIRVWASPGLSLMLRTDLLRVHIRNWVTGAARAAGEKAAAEHEPIREKDAEGGAGGRRGGFKIKFYTWKRKISLVHFQG